ncbi:maestro heat-like repeat-containing protein family member 2B [Dermochelys coriacea]|uniref:maestro heat-like repeat-containing protein family member 2B n=1 Tax=Dermochelys coriacea TaxID=27794 RepID=UPI001CAA0352|nr:maestro heat-like repeat-containing protein family member 2B [Dermochelys coriacea]
MSCQWVVDCISCLLCIQGQSINLGSAEEELRCFREALTAPDPKALFQASSKMARVVSEYFPSEQATDFIEATLDGLLSASSTCATAAGLWMKIILKECGDAMLDKVPDILAILYRHMPTIQEGSLRQFLVEAVSILAHHHREAVISSLLSKRLPMDSDTTELWRSLGGRPLACHSSPTSPNRQDRLQQEKKAASPQRLKLTGIWQLLNLSQQHVPSLRWCQHCSRAKLCRSCSQSCFLFSCSRSAKPKDKRCLCQREAARGDSEKDYNLLRATLADN